MLSSTMVSGILLFMVLVSRVHPSLDILAFIPVDQGPDLVDGAVEAMRRAIFITTPHRESGPAHVSLRASKGGMPFEFEGEVVDLEIAIGRAASARIGNRPSLPAECSDFVNSGGHGPIGSARTQAPRPPGEPDSGSATAIANVVKKCLHQLDSAAILSRKLRVICWIGHKVGVESNAFILNHDRGDSVGDSVAHRNPLARIPSIAMLVGVSQGLGE